MEKPDIIVIGTSAGGVEALQSLVSQLPANIPAAIFVVLHVAHFATSVLPDILKRAGKLLAVHPKPNQPIEHGTIYIAPPEHHLLVKDGYVTLSTGPRENGFRPAVDVLFRTAAESYGPRVIGVILTGLLDDGSAGLVAVKAHGGLAVVQDPDDADFSSMPQNALNVVNADYVLPLSKIGGKLVELCSTEVAGETGDEPMPVSTGGPNPHNDDTQDAKAEFIYSDGNGQTSPFACPECGGVLVEYRGGQNGKLVTFVCRVGHKFSLESMFLEHSEATEAALWAAVRSLEENASLSRRMAEYTREVNAMVVHEKYLERAKEAEQHAELLRQLLLGGQGQG